MEAAARRLARTLAASEFRDLETRRAAASTLPDRAGPAARQRQETGARWPPSSGRPIPPPWLTCRSAPCGRISRPPTCRGGRARTRTGGRSADGGHERHRALRRRPEGASPRGAVRGDRRSGRPPAPRRAARLPRGGAIRRARKPRLRGRRRARASGSGRRVARSRAGPPQRGDRPGLGRARGPAAGARGLPHARVRGAPGRRRRNGRRRPDHRRSRRTARERDTARRSAPAASPGPRRGSALRSLLREPGRHGHARSRGRELGAGRRGKRPASARAGRRGPRSCGILPSPGRAGTSTGRTRVPLWWPSGWRRSRSCWCADHDRPAPGPGDRRLTGCESR